MTIFATSLDVRSIKRDGGGDGLWKIVATDHFDSPETTVRFLLDSVELRDHVLEVGTTLRIEITKEEG